jgi:4-alpha-glucanotransferase
MPLHSSGICLSVASLPGPYGVGGFGDEARQFIDLLADSKVEYWQILPLTFNSSHYTPYQAQSSFAKHHLYLDPANLVSEGLLTADETVLPHDVPGKRVNRKTIFWKNQLICMAAERFYQGQARHLFPAYRAFITEHEDWLLDFVTFSACSRHFHLKGWQKWPMAIRKRELAALMEIEMKLHTFIQEELFAQFMLDRQWQAIRTHAKGRGVKIIGDIPIYCAIDSSDIWLNPQYYSLTARGHAHDLSGAPPDYFSKHGQTWGSPIYNWNRIAAENFTWPIRRFQAQFRDVDMLRIDHFFGYARYWSIPRGKTGKSGKWVTGPGDAFFDTVKKTMLPEKFIMEDLGHGSAMTERVLRTFGAPGMRAFCFEISFIHDLEKATHYKNPTVAYTGTHDTPTIMSVYRNLGTGDREKLRLWWEKLGVSHLPTSLRFVAGLLRSNAVLVIVPFQDVMGWGKETRFNTPGTNSSKNWSWRFTWDDLDMEYFKLLGEQIEASGRAPRY